MHASDGYWNEACAGESAHTDGRADPDTLSYHWASKPVTSEGEEGVEVDEAALHQLHVDAVEESYLHQAVPLGA